SMVLAVMERLEEQDHVETVRGRELHHVGGLERQSVGVEGAALRDQIDEYRIDLDRRDVVPRLEERLRRVAPPWAELEDARWRWHRDRLQQEPEEDQLIADHARSPRAIRERSPHAFREVEDRTFARRVVALPGESLVEGELVLAVGAGSRIARSRLTDDELDAIQHATPVILRYLKGLVGPVQCYVESSAVADPAALP